MVLLFMSWILLIASPINSDFDDLGASFWVILLASLVSLLLVIVSLIEYHNTGGGTALPASTR